MPPLRSTFGAGGLFAVSAASPESSVVTLEPVRILDTRDPVNVGLAGPFGSPVSQDLKVTGSVPTTTEPDRRADRGDRRVLERDAGRIDGSGVHLGATGERGRVCRRRRT